MREALVSVVAKKLGEHDTSLWRILHHFVKKAHENYDLSDVVSIGMDETSSRRGHQYITMFVDIDKRRVVYATEGKSREAIRQFCEFMSSKGGDPAKIRTVCSDMSPAFLTGIEECFPNAELTLDKFHLVKMVSEALDETRKQEGRKGKHLRGALWPLLKSPQALNEEEKAKLEDILSHEIYPLTGKVYKLKLAFQDLFKLTKEEAKPAFNAGSRAFSGVAYTFIQKEKLVLNWFHPKSATDSLKDSTASCKPPNAMQEDTEIHKTSSP